MMSVSGWIIACLHFLSKDVGIGSIGHEQFENDVISFVDNETNSENCSDENIICIYTINIINVYCCLNIISYVCYLVFKEINKFCGN